MTNRARGVHDIRCQTNCTSRMVDGKCAWCHTSHACNCEELDSEWAAIEQPYRKAIMEHTGMLSTSAAAALLGVTRWQVTRYITSGHLPATKLGRDWFIAESDLAAFTRPRKTGAPKGNQNWRGKQTAQEAL